MSNVIPFTHVRRIGALLDSQSIRRDSAGRYSLTDIHRMAGRHARHMPSNWTLRGRVDHIIDTFRQLYPNVEPLVAVTAGPNAARGTYAIAELATLYADWIDPELGLRVRELIFAGATVQNDHEACIQAAALLTEAYGGRFTVSVAVNDEPPSAPDIDIEYVTRLIANYIRDRKVVANVDIRETVHNLIGVDVHSNTIGLILGQLGCEAKQVGNGKLFITPLGLASGLSLESSSPLLTAAHIDGVNTAAVRLAGAA